ncbi:MAG: fumarylacetoacetate hydrolase family protein [Cephaloticoccus sp.]|nr:fumarylacetoacetate hydrolase family protein [Cephaloticoccus sp.]MCF7760069.1 fumarylacetoacetate hydrolase family protein [Cephaloticoccus sp.]
MRLATIMPHASVEPVVVAAATDGAWVELAGLMGRTSLRMEDSLPWLQTHGVRCAERLKKWTGPRYHESEFQFMSPVVQPPTFRDFYAFEQHVKTCRAKRGLEMAPAWYEMPVFYFSNPHALVGHNDKVHAPEGSRELDYELELGVIMGRAGRDIGPDRAWEHVAGFTILNDFSARDIQRKEVTVGLGPAKAKDFASGLGPWLVTRDEFTDRIAGETLDLAMSARVNGRELSRGNTSSLHYSIPQLIAQASRDVELYPGDLIGTGTVGTGCMLELGPENTGGWLKPGDVVELEIERLGTLRHHIVARPV